MDEKVNRRLANTLLVLLIIISLSKVIPIVQPVLQVFLMLLAPIIISFFIYYWLRPITRRFSSGRYEKYRGIISALVILIFLFLILLILSSAGSVLVNQFKDVFLDDGIVSDYKSIIQRELSTLNISPDMAKKAARTLEGAVGKIGNSIMDMFSGIGDFTTQLILIPFIVYYLLRDEEMAYESLESLIPNREKKRINPMLRKIDRVLSSYITGQLMVALIIGGLMLIGFLILKVPNALLMATFVTITSIIPIIGAFLGILPAILIALTIDLVLVVKIIILAVVVQQIEGNLITPNLMGSKLDIHPLTLMIVVIVAINLMGVFGAFIGIPAYLLISIIIKDLYGNRKQED